MFAEDYRLEDVTPERMRELNDELERRAVENETFNGKNLLNTYTCEDCGHRMVTKDLHVGTTPYTMACGREGCGGTAVSSMYRPRKLGGENESWDYEWFRPLTEEECGALKRDAREHAASVDLSDYDEGDRDHIREVIANEMARHVLAGGLDRRPVKSGERRSE